jgi:hypothetical protein
MRGMWIALGVFAMACQSPPPPGGASGEAESHWL